jgi:hypothetical protein
MHDDVLGLHQRPAWASVLVEKPRYASDGMAPASQDQNCVVNDFKFP